MERLFWEEREGKLRFGETAAARRRAALKRFAFTTVAGAALMIAFLLPDYVGRYGEMDPTGGALFFGAIGALAALIGFALALSRAARREVWVLDVGAARQLALERSVFGRAPSVEAIELTEIARVAVEDGELAMHLSGGERVPLVAAPEEELRALAAQLDAHAGRRRVALTVEQ